MTTRKRVVFKIEIDTLMDNSGKPLPEKTEKLAMVCSNLQNSGVSVMIVSSGAIALGSAHLKNRVLPDGIPGKQVAAAVGQAEMIMMYQEYFDHYDQIVAQVLLTRDVIDNPDRNRNAVNTFSRLLQQGIIPIINENDSVSTNDIILNDNYPLALIVASLTSADAIVINTFNGEKYMLLTRGNRDALWSNVNELANVVAALPSTGEDCSGIPSGFPEFSKAMQETVKTI